MALDNFILSYGCFHINPNKHKYAAQSTSSTSVESLGPSLLSQPATDPPVHGMRIVSNDFAWDIPTEARSSSFITVETVLFAIYATLHQPVKPVEWNAVEEPREGLIGRGVRDWTKEIAIFVSVRK